MDLSKSADWFADRLLKRFLRYVECDTTSDRHVEKIPSTPGQRVLAEELARELDALGCRDASVDKHGYAFARLGASGLKTKAPPLALIAHLDTSSEAPGKNVKPQVHENYDGRPIRLQGGLTLDPAESNALLAYRGSTIVTSSGETLLGADDKAGLAAVVTAVEYLSRHPAVAHGDLEIVFTPDEETGRGTARFPWEKVKAKAAVTVDGGGDGVIESECFTAYRAAVTVRGKSFHPGESRGRLINAVEIASAFVDRVPKSESPQATDGRYGYYAPLEMRGTVEEAAVEFIIRDFAEAGCARRLKALRALAKALEKLHPGAAVGVKTARQYANMKPFLAQDRSGILSLLREAVRLTGVTPREEIIRGGTDGARLSERGLPCPNLFAGGFNFHARTEWAALPAMARSAQALVYLAWLWGKKAAD